MAFWDKTYQYSSVRLFTFICVVLCLGMMPFASSSGYTSYVYTLGIFIAFNFMCDKDHREKNFAYFHFFLVLAFLVYFLQRVQLPHYMGLTGPEGGIGTDDVRYYAGLDVKITYTTDRMDIAMDNPYTNLLRIVYPFKIGNPIDIVIFNILGIAFMPYLTYKTARIFFDDERISFIAERLTLFCPFMMSIGLIIMRDVMCSSLILASFCCFAQKKYIPFALFTGLLAFLKFGFVVFLCVPMFAFLVYRENQKSMSQSTSRLKFLILSAIILAVFVIFILPNLATLTGGRLTSESLFRDSFLEYLEGANDESILVKLYALPVVIRIPALIVTFLVIPPLTFNIYSEHIFLIRSFLQNVMAPIYWWPLYLFFFKFLFSYRKLNAAAKTIFYILIFMALALGMISLQTRHKAALLPFFYIAISYSIVHLGRSRRFISLICLIFFIIAQIIYSYLHL